MHSSQQDNVLGFGGGSHDEALMFLCYCEVTVAEGKNGLNLRDNRGNDLSIDL